jgi:hypothetical protein
MFVDADGDGSYDGDETIVPASTVRFRQPVRVETDGDLLRVHDLVPYHRYEVGIDLPTIADPALVPAFTTFSFVADPNVYRTIDVPLQESGELDGRVLRRVAVGYEGIAGLNVYLRREGDASVTTLRTYSDGGFYVFGLPPGRYEVTLDTTQLRNLDVRAEPERLAVEVTSLARGTSDAIRFALEPRASSRNTAPDPVEDDLEALLEGAKAAEERGDLRLAVELTHRLLLLDPDDPDSYVRLGRIYDALGDLARARDAYRRSLSLVADLPSARRELGLVLFALGDRIEAEAVLRGVLAETPDDLEVLSALAALEGI